MFWYNKWAYANWAWNIGSTGPNGMKGDGIGKDEKEGIEGGM
jgi:hypothetical protein